MNDPSPTILVIGASGRTGWRICRGLLDRGVPVRGLTHSDDGAGRLSALGVRDVVRADLLDPATLPPAFEGVDHVMLVTRSIGDPTPEINAVGAAVGAGVRRVVKLSSDILYRTWDDVDEHERAQPPNPVAALHGPSEDHIRASGVEHVLLRSTWFAGIDENPLFGPGINAGGLVWPLGSSGLALVHPDDVAETAVHHLLVPEVQEPTLRLTGPREIGAEEIAAGFGALRGSPVEVRPVSFDAYGAWLEAVAGMPRSAARIIEPYAEPPRVPLSDAIERALGRPARTFADYLNEQGGHVPPRS
ncbi:Uncharacterized conserved protein YbjT, contains NAD(P)-binding and DUF2867 domains [Pseudonocardia ammonioxydans]|uniref:Uncharacterized conserved protein YbjT, contains NAD(P)-binding and DUF2867 domains n=1 Tax=Pseudonocardia ammonioxydans TaxID=260086 RepID=A0A1I5HQD5_PSUAM|nr:NAD(P)H-binding protein [Pseudonocardia ammonioxydans]SFO50116.1 Uncharacterized conserved protein YbjT, contains NAD(P)-binding and DUF2867 domains [Pseudonocardia ammonioxydans]